MLKRQIAVFGASGKIGSAVTERLIEAGHDVTSLRHRRDVPEGSRIVDGSVSDHDAVMKTIGENEIVLQFATTKGDPEHFLDVAVGGTFRILDAVRKRGGCDQFLLAGGDCALGIWFYRHTSPLTEMSPMRAYPGYYALSKVMEETLVQQYHHQYGMPFTILRMGWVHSHESLLKLFPAGNVAGRQWDHMFRNEMPPDLQKRADGHGEGFIFTAVDNASGIPIRRTTVSYRDVVSAWELAVGNPLAVGEVFNVVHPAWDYSAAARLVSDKTGAPAVPVPLDAHSWDMDTTKIRKMLGWTPEDCPMDMLEKALDRI